MIWWVLKWLKVETVPANVIFGKNCYSANPKIGFTWPRRFATLPTLKPLWHSAPDADDDIDVGDYADSDDDADIDVDDDFDVDEDIDVDFGFDDDADVDDGDYDVDVS